MADQGKRTVKKVTPPGERPTGGDSGDAKSGGGARASAPRRSPGRPTQYDKLQADLEDLFGTVAMVQGGMVLVTADERHELGAEVTIAYAPKLAEAWVELARQDQRVFTMLKRLTTGSAWGGVIMTTGGFLLAQASAYGLMDWANIAPAGVPAGDPSDPRTNGTGEAVPPVPPVTDAKDPRNSSPDGGVSTDPAQNPAEQQRRAVERRRQQRGS